MSTEKKRDHKKQKKQKKELQELPQPAAPVQEKKHHKKSKKKHRHTENDEETIQTVTPEKTLEEQISEDNDFFLSVINLIPSQFYFQQKDDDGDGSQPTSGGKGKKGKKGKRGISSPDGHQAKRAKFDPDCNLTTQRAAAREADSQSRKGKVSRHPAELAPPSGIEEVRERLHRRLEELKQQRCTMKRGVYKDEKQRLRRREHNLKMKMKRKLEKSHKTAPQPKVNGEFPKEPTKPIFNKEGKLVYSKFDFTDLGDKQDKAKNEFSGKNYKKLLAKVEKRNEKLRQMRESNPEKAESAEEKLKWQSALQRAEGVKVKDNPDLLKKAIRSKEKLKNAKTKKWEARLERTEKMKDDKQQKRSTNIKAQKQKNLDRKVQKLKKKGRLIPGF